MTIGSETLPGGPADGAPDPKAGPAAPTEPDASGSVGRLRAWATRGAPMYPLGVLFGLNMVDELDRAAFGVLLPEIRDHFGLDLGGILTVYSVSVAVALMLAVPVGFYSDRLKRTRIAAGGASAWGFFSALTAFAPNVWTLGAARAGTNLGRMVNEPVHNSLLADYYDIPARPRVYALHRGASPIGQIIGPVAAGVLAFSFGWRVPFIVFTVVTATFVVMALRLREPVRGRFERQAAGASEEIANAEEESPSWAESWRILWHVRTVRRVYYSVPIVALLMVGHPALASLFFEDIFGMDERARGFVGALANVGAVIGVLVGGAISGKLVDRDPGLLLKLAAFAAMGAAAANALFALSPSQPVAVLAMFFFTACSLVLTPGFYAILSLAMPAKVRSFGYGVMWLWAIPAMLLVPIVGAIGDAHGLRVGLLALTPLILLFGFMISSAAKFVAPDVDYVNRSSAARSEVAHERREGRVKLLLARGIDVHYGGVQVLFKVDLDVDEGEIVALLGTNGAGKSTLLRAMSGLVQPTGGVVFFDGRDMTHTPPDEVAARGIAQVPGGQGVFTQLSVADNLRLAGWLHRKDQAEVQTSTERVLEIFPVLGERLAEPAGNLSGGQQQMLTLGMAFIGRPRMLFIDELSLGLAPTVVAQLLEMVRALRDEGVTIILVEQSVNVALTVAEKAYFMEKGEIRFEGPTAELLERPDLLRSVFLSGGPSAGDRSEAPAEVPAEAMGNGADGAAAPSRDPGRPVLEVRGVTKSFGGVRALSDVSFDVWPDEVVGFIGPNGAGKTTLFDVLSGFTQADAGTVRLRTGEQVNDLHRLPAHRRAWRGLGRSFQDGRLFGGLSVIETIAVALEQHTDVRHPVLAALRLPMVGDSESKVQARVDELIDLLGLGAYRNKFLRELSTGTRRIVDLACVLAQGPKVVLLDEPSSGIAQREAEALGPVLQNVRRELGASLLVIEHDLPLLRSIADRMIALDLGRVVSEGRPGDVLNHPEVVASYLGTDSTAIDRSGAPTPG